MKLYAIVASSTNQFWWGTLEPETTSSHIVRMDNTVMELLEGNGWLDSKSWLTSAANGTQRIHRGVYPICDGGYGSKSAIFFSTASPGSAATILYRTPAIVCIPYCRPAYTGDEKYPI